MGVELLSSKMTGIWATQEKHLRCLQDPEGLEMYTVVGHSTKGGIRLPVYRSARGTTSLEFFHLHQAQFIPGEFDMPSHKRYGSNVNLPC